MRKLIDEKKAKPERPIEIVIIIRPNCLKVDKAVTFFKSNSKFAPSTSAQTSGVVKIIIMYNSVSHNFTKYNS